MLLFEWDTGNRNHIARHNVLPTEAEEVIQNAPYDLGRQIYNGELRFAQVGETRSGRILQVVTTERSGKVRVVTAFEANQKLRRYYVTQRRNKLRDA